MPRYAGQVSDEIEPGVIVRSHPNTGVIESLDILDFTYRCQAGGVLELPISVNLGSIAEALDVAAL